MDEDKKIFKEVEVNTNSLIRRIEELEKTLRDENMRRIYQEDLAPSAVKPRAVSEDFIISSDHLSASTTLSNGEYATLTITTSQENNSKIFAVPDISIYIGSVADANQLPTGIGADSDEWQVIGPWNDWGATDNLNVKTKLFVHNLSAGATQSVLFRVKVRYLSNLPDASSA